MHEKKNILWINILKAICIIGVYFVHSNQYYGIVTGLINTFIHPFYVNAFFFISGYLFFRKQLSDRYLNISTKEYMHTEGKSLLYNILYRLCIPSILFSFINFLPSYILRGYNFDLITLGYKTLGGCTFWFTSALIVSELMLLLLLLTRKKNIWFYFICSALIFSIGRYIVVNKLSLFSSYPSFPWQYKHGMYAIIFLALGGVYWKFENIVNKLMNKYVLFLMTIFYAVVLWRFPSYCRVLVSMLDVNLLGIGLSLLSTIILIEICKLLPEFKFMNYVGQNTIGLYFMSGALPIVFSMFIHRFAPTENILGLIVVLCGSLCVGIVMVYFINKYIPWLFDLRLLIKRLNTKR